MALLIWIFTTRISTTSCDDALVIKPDWLDVIWGNSIFLDFTQQDDNVRLIFAQSWQWGSVFATGGR